MVATINERLIDVDFRNEAAGLGRATGGMTRFEAAGTFRPVYEEVHGDELIPEREWQGLIEAHTGMEPLLGPTQDQGREDSCTSHQETKKWSVACYRQFGVLIELSGISLYRQVQNGPGGSTLPDNARAIAEVGALPADNPANRERLAKAGLVIPDEHYHPARGYYVKPGEQWRETAALFRADEQCDVVSFEGLMSCLLRGLPVGYARDGHCILAVRPMWDAKRGYVIKYKNSWGVWGDDGCGYDTRDRLDRRGRLPYGGGTVMRTIVTPAALVRAPADALAM